MDFHKVQPGDPLQIPAQTFNACIDAAIGYRQSQRPGADGKLNRQKNSAVILVQNTTGGNLDRWACVQLDAPMVEPDNSDDDAPESNEFQNRLVLTAIAPTDPTKPWGIIQGPLPDQQIGEAVIIGATIAKIDLIDAADSFVDSDAAALVPKSGTTGRAQIIWVQGGVGTADDVGEQFAVIHIGGGGGSTETIGTDVGQVHIMVAADTDGWEYPFSVTTG